MSMKQFVYPGTLLFYSNMGPYMQMQSLRAQCWLSLGVDPMASPGIRVRYVVLFVIPSIEAHWKL
jgi:hypothetical protein